MSNYSGAYKAMNRFGIREDVIKFFKPKDKLISDYTKEDCLEVALRYKYRCEFKENHYSLYSHSIKMGWRKDITKHLVHKPRNVYWTYERCKEEALKYNKRDDIRIYAKGCSNAIYENKWFELLPPPTTRKSKWTYENSLEESKKYKSRYDFKNGCKSAYEVSRINKWLDTFYPKK
jgi:hypothetical protein